MNSAMKGFAPTVSSFCESFHRPKKPRQLVMSILQCQAKTKKGPQCSFKQKFGSFCGHHKL